MNYREQSARQDLDRAVDSLLHLVEGIARDKASSDLSIVDEVDRVQTALEVLKLRRADGRFNAERPYDQETRKSLEQGLEEFQALERILKEIETLKKSGDPESLAVTSKLVEHAFGSSQEYHLQGEVAFARIETSVRRPSLAIKRLEAVLTSNPRRSDAWVARAEAFASMGAFGLADVHLQQPAVKATDDTVRMVLEGLQLLRTMEEDVSWLDGRFQEKELLAQAEILAAEGHRYGSLVHAIASVKHAVVKSDQVRGLLFIVRNIQENKSLELFTIDDRLLLGALRICDWGCRLDSSFAWEFAVQRAHILYELRDYEASLEEAISYENLISMQTLKRRAERRLRYQANPRRITAGEPAVGREGNTGSLYGCQGRGSGMHSEHIFTTSTVFLGHASLMQGRNYVTVGRFDGEVPRAWKADDHISVVDLRAIPPLAQSLVMRLRRRSYQLNILVSETIFAIEGLNVAAQRLRDPVELGEDDFEALLVTWPDVLATAHGLLGVPSCTEQEGRDLAPIIRGERGIRPLLIAQYFNIDKPFPVRFVQIGPVNIPLGVGARFMHPPATSRINVLQSANVSMVIVAIVICLASAVKLLQN
jgi:hypothetical protein